MSVVFFVFISDFRNLVRYKTRNNKDGGKDLGYL